MEKEYLVNFLKRSGTNVLRCPQSLITMDPALSFTSSISSDGSNHNRRESNTIVTNPPLPPLTTQVLNATNSANETISPSSSVPPSCPTNNFDDTFNCATSLGHLLHSRDPGNHERYTKLSLFYYGHGSNNTSYETFQNEIHKIAKDKFSEFKMHNNS